MIHTFGPSFHADENYFYIVETSSNRLSLPDFSLAEFTHHYLQYVTLCFNARGYVPESFDLDEKSKTKTRRK